MTQLEINKERAKSGDYFCVTVNGEPNWIYTDESEAQAIVERFSVRFPNCAFEIVTEW